MTTDTITISSPEDPGFGAWSPDEALMVRFVVPDESPWPIDRQQGFIRDLKAMARRWGLQMLDWGPEKGMMAKLLLEDPRVEDVARLDDLELVMSALVEITDPRTLPSKVAAASQRILKRIQERP